MTAEDFRRAIRRAVAQAMESEPSNAVDRARCFAACLTGRLSAEEFDVAQMVWHIVSDEPLQTNEKVAA